MGHVARSLGLYRSIFTVKALIDIKLHRKFYVTQLHRGLTAKKLKGKAKGQERERNIGINGCRGCTVRRTG